MKGFIRRQITYSARRSCIVLLILCVSILGASVFVLSSLNSSATKDTTKAFAHPSAAPYEVISGTYSQETKTFSASGKWRVIWSCDPLTSYGKLFTLTLVMPNKKGDRAYVVLANIFCTPDDFSGQSDIVYTGNALFNVNSVGAWRLAVTKAK